LFFEASPLAHEGLRLRSIGPDGWVCDLFFYTG
jgi:hypothetical protein